MDQNWIEKWKEDLTYILEELPKKHLNLFFNQSEEKFLFEISRLKEDISEGDLDHFVVISRLASLIASFKDAHTTLYIPGKWFLPFDFYWFEEGVYIIGGLEKYRSLIGCRITHINKLDISEVIKRLRTVISFENESFLMSQLPKYIRVAEVLYGLDIISDLKNLSIMVEYADGIISEIQVNTYDHQELSIGYIYIDDLLEREIPLYRRRRGENYWSQYYEDDKLLYINYNCCKNMENIGVKDYFTGVFADILRLKVSYVVVDLRNNFGGNSKLLEPFILDLKNWQMDNKSRRVFTVIGRDTFSSALLNAYSMKDDVGSILVGEASGGKPDCYGEVHYLELPNSKLRVRYSTKYYNMIDNDDQLSLFPDIKFVVRFEDYINCKDPVMEYIFNGRVE